MDVSTALNAASATLQILIPYVKDLGEGVTKKAGEALFSWLRSKFQPASEGAEALEALQKQPDNTSASHTLQTSLTQLLSARPELLAELQAVLRYCHSSQASAVINQQAGDRATQFGQVFGDVTFKR
jgi:hypothetical protein